MLFHMINQICLISSILEDVLQVIFCCLRYGLFDISAEWVPEFRALNGGELIALSCEGVQVCRGKDEL